jgi:hypothetical protein
VYCNNICIYCEWLRCDFGYLVALDVHLFQILIYYRGHAVA